MAHESGEQLEIALARAPKEGLLSKDMIEVAVLKRRVDVLMDEIAALKQSQKALLKRFNSFRKTKSWKEKLYDLFRKA